MGGINVSLCRHCPTQNIEKPSHSKHQHTQQCSLWTDCESNFIQTPPIFPRHLSRNATPTGKLQPSALLNLRSGASCLLNATHSHGLECQVPKTLPNNLLLFAVFSRFAHHQYSRLCDKHSQDLGTPDVPVIIRVPRPDGILSIFLQYLQRPAFFFCLCLNQFPSLSFEPLPNCAALSIFGGM